MIKYILFFTLGIITWTFLEYCIHRFLGHKKRKNALVKKEHLMHHRLGDYFAPLYKKIILAIIVLSIATLLLALPFNIATGFSFALGICTMYILYEITHRRFHVKAPLIRYGLRMRKHHFFHHYGNPKFNHGVTTAFWDRIFKTYQSVSQVNIPKKMTMIWLDSNNAKYQKHFIIY
ncbi:MAG: sterol desaturase family protein [Chitinophagales bacterium]|nr:sterol desaturase family protein [Chitinophagales bacterium]